MVERERLVKVVTRRTTVGQISMWGTLHLNLAGGNSGGWLCDSWTEAGTPASEVLRPRLLWLSKEDDQFYRAVLDIPVVGVSNIKIGPVDEPIEPRRLAFVRATLAQWEDEFLASQSVQVG
jgi:hypothetical protein